MDLLKKVVFLDRDGVINRDSPEYIKSWSEFEFIPGSVAAIKALTSNGFTTIVITNQSALARRLITRRELELIHATMCKTIATAHGRITDIFFCPHMPADGCDCRKPEPGLIFQAQRRYNIDLAQAVMVGDSAKDIECARKAGCGRAVLIAPGTDRQTEKALRIKRLDADYIAQNLADAVQWILVQSNLMPA